MKAVSSKTRSKFEEILAKKIKTALTRINIDGLDNNIENKDALMHKWIIPVQDSWIWKKISKSIV